MPTPEDQLVDTVLSAYRGGWFPMADPDRGVIEWVQPHRRGVIPLAAGGFQIPQTLRQRVRSGRFEIRGDTVFERVIRACAEARPGREKSWIDERIVRAYTALHRAGHTHSVEAWLRPAPTDARGSVLVGGLYGVHLGGVFFGESMFSRPELGGTDASKVCLVHLVHHLRRRGFVLLDTQMWSPHLARYGCVEIPGTRFRQQLACALTNGATWGTFDPEGAPKALSGPRIGP